MDKERYITLILKMMINMRIHIDTIKISKEDKNDLIYYYNVIKQHLNSFIKEEEKEMENIKYRYNQNKKLMEEMEKLENE